VPTGEVVENGLPPAALARVTEIEQGGNHEPRLTDGGKQRRAKGRLVRT
jgi:hypothetical protein